MLNEELWAIDALGNEATDQGLTADKFDVKFIGFHTMTHYMAIA